MALSDPMRWLRNRMAAQLEVMTRQAFDEFNEAVECENVALCALPMLAEFRAVMQQGDTEKKLHALGHIMALCTEWLRSTRSSTAVWHTSLASLRWALRGLADSLRDGEPDTALALRAEAAFRELIGERAP